VPQVFILNLAIFGGTFDPIHTAHLTVAREAAAQFQLDRILFVPAANPPHKSDLSADYEDRYRMVELACEGQPDFVPSRLESGKRKSYSIHTIEKVRAEMKPEDRLFFVIGADAFAEIGTWYRTEDVIRLVEFIVVTRPGHDYATPPAARVHRLDTLALPVSSSEVRQELAAGREPEELPPAVLSFIRERGLYGVRPALS
jgi:nicotinate-nucleotide adenylyltransferase